MIGRVAMLAVAIGAMSGGIGWSQTAPDLQREQMPTWAQSVSRVPTEPSQPKERELRYARNAEFDDKTGSKRALESPSEPNEPLVGHGYSIYYTRISPLPSSTSDAVVVGSVSGFQAYFSNDRTAIYTELQVHVERTFKDNSKTIGSVLVIDEGGGAIRLSDGKILRQERFPLETDIDLGKRYVLFLKYEEGTKTFRIVKAWELRNGQAQPLAKTDLKDQRDGVSKYAGMAADKFYNVVEQSVAAHSE